MSTETRYEPPPVSASEVLEPSRRRGRFARKVWITAVVALLVGLAGGYVLRWGTAPSGTPQALQVARQYAAVFAGSPGSYAQKEDAEKALALFADGAVATDVPSGETVIGRNSIRNGFLYVFAQGGTWKVDHVLGDGRSAMVMLTWTGTGRGGQIHSTPWVSLLEVRNGLIVSESDIYDDPFGWDK